jgi:signal-transduction protein with cAMP-binding, CBS, and nucleotidyltransferase domain
MESAMINITAEDIIRDKGEEPLSVPPETLIYDALKLLVEKGASGILVKKEGTYVGIWTERDLMKNVITEGFDPKRAKIGDYMASPLITAPHTDTIFQLIDKFLGLKVRHLLIEKNGEYIGMLYGAEVIRAGFTERTKELKELNTMVSLDYYEDWKWEKRKKEKERK